MQQCSNRGSQGVTGVPDSSRGTGRAAIVETDDTNSATPVRQTEICTCATLPTEPQTDVQLRQIPVTAAESIAYCVVLRE